MRWREKSNDLNEMQRGVISSGWNALLAAVRPPSVPVSSFLEIHS